MGCLAELIGYNYGCGSVTGRVSLNEIGITEKEITDYLSGDNLDVASFLSERISMGERWVETDMLTRLAPRMIGKTFLDRGRVGDFDERQTLQTGAAGTLGGIVLDVCAPGSNLVLLISRLELWTDSTGTVAVTFKDLTDGATLATATVDTTADRISATDVEIRLPIHRKRTRILVTTNLTSYYRATAGVGSCTTCNGTSFKQGPFEAYGARIPSAAVTSYANIQRQTHTSGMGLVATLACDHAAYTCEHKGLLALPLAFKVAEEIVSFGLGNFDRVNARVNSGNREALENRRNDFGRKYTDAMGRLWDNMPTPNDPQCWVCNSRIRVNTVLP